MSDDKTPMRIVTKRDLIRGVAAKGRQDLVGLRQMRAWAKPGECLFCGDPAIPLSEDPQAVARRVTGRTHQDTCGAPECKVARIRYWRRDDRRPKQHVIPYAQTARAMRRAAMSWGAVERWAA